MKGLLSLEENGIMKKNRRYGLPKAGWVLLGLGALMCARAQPPAPDRYEDRRKGNPLLRQPFLKKLPPTVPQNFLTDWGTYSIISVF